MDLSIVIINYNTGQLTEQCIKSIIRETRDFEFEIILIDNASSEPIEFFIKDFAEIRLIKNKENIGFGPANNQGIRLARGKFILLLNSDTIVINRAIDQCLSYLKKNDDIGLLGCKLLYEDGSIQKSLIHKSTPWQYLINSNPLFSKGLSIKPKYDYNKIQRTSGVSGAFMLFRKEVFQKVKPFDPDIFMYSEETELCRNRISEHFNIIYYPEATVIHLGGKSAPKEIMYHQAMLSYALVWYKRGYFHYLYYLLVSLNNLLSSLLGYIFAGKTGKKELKKVIKGYLKIAPYLVGEIPRYPRAWGSRPDGLRLKELR